MRSTLSVALCATLTLCIPAHAQGLQLFKPLAAPEDAWSCKAEALGQDGGALGLSQQEMIGIGSSCTLNNPVNIRNMEALLYDASCTTSGDTDVVRVMIMPSPGGVYIIRDKQVFEWIRCPAP